MTEWFCRSLPFGKDTARSRMQSVPRATGRADRSRASCHRGRPRSVWHGHIGRIPSATGNHGMCERLPHTFTLVSRIAKRRKIQSALFPCLRLHAVRSKDGITFFLHQRPVDLQAPRDGPHAKVRIVLRQRIRGIVVGPVLWQILHISTGSIQMTVLRESLLLSACRQRVVGICRNLALEHDLIVAVVFGYRLPLGTLLPPCGKKGKVPACQPGR